MKMLPDWFENQMNKDIDDLEKEFKTIFDEADKKILKIAYMKGYKRARGIQ